MAHLRSLSTDTPWHIEKMVREEGDERRHRTYCANYNKDTKYCRYFLSVCRGTAHCKHYVDSRIKGDKDRYEQDSERESSKPPTIAPGQKLNITLPKALPSEAKGVTVNTRVVHPKYGIGIVYRFDQERKHIYVDFPSGVKAFIFPDIFEMGLLKKK